MPYILAYCEATNETISKVMEEDVMMIFYVVSYLTFKHNQQKRMLNV